MRSSRYPVLFLVVAGALMTGDHAYAQEQDARGEDEARGRNALLAGMLEWYIPVVGHAYAGDAASGVLPNLVAFGGFAAGLLLCPVVHEECELHHSPAVLQLSLLTLLVGRAWAVVSAMETAVRTNALVKKRPTMQDGMFDLSVTPAGRIEMGVVIGF